MRRGLRLLALLCAITAAVTDLSGKPRLSEAERVLALRLTQTDLLLPRLPHTGWGLAFAAPPLLLHDGGAF